MKNTTTSIIQFAEKLLDWNQVSAALGGIVQKICLPYFIRNKPRERPISQRSENYISFSDNFLDKSLVHIVTINSNIWVFSLTFAGLLNVFISKSNIFNCAALSQHNFLA